MEVETRHFYEKAAARTQDASIRQLLDDLVNEEREHEERAQELDEEKLPARRKPMKSARSAGSSCCRSCSLGWRA